MIVPDNPHLAVFRASLKEELPIWVGEHPAQWAANVLPPALLAQAQQLPESRLSRDALFKRAQDSNVDDLDIATCILAWGGMQPSNGKRVFRRWDEWKHVVGKLRLGNLDRIKAYSEFQSIRKAGNLPGMGPAYFTKLIYFCSPRHDGFIMDQWTARSANLLLGRRLVKTERVAPRKGAWDRNPQRVSDQNDEDVYQCFCTFISKLAEQVGRPGEEDEIERRLFSAGRRQGCWRSYVISGNIGGACAQA